MEKILNKFINSYATFSYLYNHKLEKELIIKYINELPLGGILNLLSQLSCASKDDKNIRNLYYDFLVSEGLTRDYISSKLDNKFLYTTQTLSFLWKWFLAYGNKDRLNEEVDINFGIVRIIHFGLVISDYLSETASIYEIFSNLSFNSSKDDKSLIARAYFIFVELSVDSSLYNPNDFLDFNTDYDEFNGFSISEYIAVLIGIIGSFNLENNPIQSNWAKNKDSFFSGSKIDDKLLQISEKILLSFDEAKHWSVNNIDSYWDYNLFRKKPLLLLENAKILPISPTFILENLYIELFYKIREIYEVKDKRFLTFSGRPFEKYVSLYLEKAVEVSVLPYTFVPEFKYGENKSKSSSDCYLKLGNKLLAFEAKRMNLRVDSFAYSKEQTINEDISKMIIDPLLQINDSLYELTIEKNSLLNGITEIYMVSVTFGEIPTIAPLEKIIEEKLRTDAKLPFKSYYHLDIAEYEILCYQITRPKAHPIFRTLDNFAKTLPKMSFNNFIFYNKIPVKRMDYFHRKFSEVIQHLNDLL